MLDGGPPAERRERRGRQPRWIHRATGARLDQRPRERSVAAQHRNRAGHHLLAGDGDDLEVAVQLGGVVPGHAWPCLLPCRRRGVGTGRGIPDSPDDERARRRDLMFRHAKLVVEMIGVGPPKVRVRLAEDRAVVRLDRASFEGRRREFLDDGHAPVREPEVEQGESIAMQPDGGRRCEELVAEADDRSAHVTADGKNGLAVRREDRGEIALFARNRHNARPPRRNDDDAEHGRRDPANQPHWRDLRAFPATACRDEASYQPPKQPPKQPPTIADSAMGCVCLTRAPEPLRNSAPVMRIVAR